MSKVYAVDIETSPHPAWAHYEDAALDHNRNQIDLIAVYGEDFEYVFNDVQAFNTWARGKQLVFHNGKFDLKTLIKKGLQIDLDMQFVGDTQLMAVALSDKIPEAWLENYNKERVIRNKAIGGVKQVHRQAGQYSLKTLAPYHLGVDAFWEVADHNDVEYALKDARYTYQLHGHLHTLLVRDGTLDFYEKQLMPICRMLLRAELRGISIDLAKLQEEWEKEKENLKILEARLDELWADAHKKYVEQEQKSVIALYKAKAEQAVAKLKDSSKALATHKRYGELCGKALAKCPTRINLSSPTQLAWLLKGHLGLDISKPMGDDDEESTGKAVLQGLAATGREDIKTFLQYRESSKLVTAFFPSYEEMAYAGTMHTNFNQNGTRTGRLSSNGPNLQQVPRTARFRSLFRARDGHKLVVYDLGAIEPVVIAFLTEDETLCRLLTSGSNFHSNNVRVFFNINAPDGEIKKKYGNERDLAKEVGLALMYGAGPRRLMVSAQKRGFHWSMGKCKSVYERFKDEYRGVFAFKKRLDESLESGEAMANVLGRKLVIPNMDDVYMKGFNTLIQSSASDMLLNAARKAEIQLQGKAWPLLFVHDETVFEAKSEFAEEASRALKASLEAPVLDTAKFGRIPVVAEGGVYEVWQK